MALPLFIVACASTTKYVPDGQYLLEQVDIQIEGDSPSSTDLLPFVQQSPNGSKFGVKIYNSVSNDSTWLKRMIRKLGEEPVIFRKTLVGITETELAVQMKNLGYLNVEVSSQIDTLDKLAKVTYIVEPNEPYLIRNYEIKVPNPRAERRRRAEGENFGGREQYSRNREAGKTDTSDSLSRFQRFLGRANRNPILLKEGDLFNMNVLEQERQRVNRSMQNQGYYASNINNLHYWADTTLRSNQVDLTLGILDSTLIVPYTVNRVNVYSGYDPLNKRRFHTADSSVYKNIHIYWDKMNFLRPGVIASKVMVRPNSTYRITPRENTYNQLKTLKCVGRVDVNYEQGNYADSTLLDCNIYLSPGTIHSVQTGFEGTHKDGDFGLALDLTYGHLNIFNGSESFNVNLRAAYEFVNSKGNSDSQLDNNYYEFGITPSLSFPEMHFPFVKKYMDGRFSTETQYSLGYNIQRRPSFTRNFFNFNWKYRWSAHRKNVSHYMSLLDVNYVNMPWKSESFQDYLTNHVDSLTKYSYENIFTAGINYGFNYGNSSKGKVRENLYTIRFNMETSGNVLNWLNKAWNGERNEAGQYTILGNPFAQYLKGDIDFTETFKLDNNNAIAFRAGLGLAYPLGNSKVLPFEKRYYGGGPNNVRGWSTRYLGPGSYNHDVSNPVIHVGDMRFITSLEYRLKVTSWLEPALFVDAGNIWTLKEYENQPGGQFKWDSFYKELAVGAGVGFRVDLSFLVVRLDFATRLVDPARQEGDRWVLFKEKFFPNSNWYLAIGYPF